jgi:uncharacterized membrane protein
MKRWMIILFLLSFLPLVNLLTPGIMDAHDAPDHVARVANFFNSLSEGVLIPRWAGNLNWGYGHPILMFLYPLPSYTASFFHALGASLVDSVKLTFAVSYIGSIIFFFLWASVAYNPVAAVVGSILYGFAPYRFVDLYVRGAFGEHMAFTFAPLLLLGLVGLAKGKKYWPLPTLIVAVAGLLLSHNAVSLMIFPLVLLYGVYLAVFEAKQRMVFVRWVALGFAIGFAASAFFWMPAFFEGKYTLRDIVTRGEFANRFVPWLAFLYSPWNYGISHEFSKEVGRVHLVAVLIGIVSAMRSSIVAHRWFLWGSIAVFIGSLFVMTSSSAPLWQMVTILQKFQFPWRFLTVSVFVSSVIATVVVSRVRKPFGYWAVGIALCAVVLSMPMWKAKGYIVRDTAHYTGIYKSTTDTGESSPIWSVRFMEHMPQHFIEVIEGIALIEPKDRTSTQHSYIVSAESRVRLVENTLYFPGWRVLVDGNPVAIEFQDPTHRGLMTFWVDPGVHEISVVFGQTKLRRVADILSLLGLFALCVIATIPLWNKRSRSH